MSRPSVRAVKSYRTENPPSQIQLDRATWHHQIFLQFPQDFAWVKHLGTGGEAGADLWQIRGICDGVVVKTCKGPSNTIINEIERMVDLCCDDDSHPKIIHLIRVAVDWPRPTLHSIWLPYYPLGDLNRWSGQHFFSRSQAVPETFIWDVFVQLTDAVGWLHTQRRSVNNAFAWSHRPPTIHGDIKPANVLVESFDHNTIKIVLSDFGMARAEDRVEAQPFETYEYQGHDWYHGKPLDIWGIGALVHYLAKGQPPISRQEIPLPAPAGSAELRSILDPNNTLSARQYMHRTLMWRFPREVQDMTHPSMRHHYQSYSPFLQAAVAPTLLMHPSERPDAHALYQSVEQLYRQWDVQLNGIQVPQLWPYQLPLGPIASNDHLEQGFIEDVEQADRGEAPLRSQAIVFQRHVLGPQQRQPIKKTSQRPKSQWKPKDP